jgi:uncharacterized protein YjbI with pentapeptide repeats
MAKEDLELSKLALEIESLRGQLDQAQQAKRKLELEVGLLSSQVGRFGTFARVAWPIVSVILSTAIALMALVFTLRANGVDAEQKSLATWQKEKEIFNFAAQEATDESKGNDVRISGIWTLNDPYFDWNNKFFQTTSHVLVAALVTGSDEDDPRVANSKQTVRLAAAQVLGGPVPCVPSQSGVQSPAQATAKFLFGTVENKLTPGLISKAESYLTLRRSQVKDATVVDLKLSAIRLVVQRYRACFAKADLSDYDLRTIDLSTANLADAVLIGANLQDSDLRGGNLQGTDLSDANLFGSHLAQTVGWNQSIVKGANIRNLQDAPAGFREWALSQHAVDMESSGWSLWKTMHFPEPRDWEKWRVSGFSLRSDGVPAQ